MLTQFAQKWTLKMRKIVPYAVIIPIYIFFAGAQAPAQELGLIRGHVRDARGGEPLARVQVQLWGTTRQALTDALGHFELSGVRAGDYELRVSTVGYMVLKKNISLAAGDIEEFEIVLSPETARRTDSIDVQAGRFDPPREGSPSVLSLNENEVQNLSSVLAEDPLRAVQALPGVAADDDFNSRFSLHGAAYHRIGLYLDDVQLHSPFHTVQSEPSSGSLTIFNGDTVGALDLFTAAYSPRYSDTTAGALDVHTREGSRERFIARVTSSAVESSALAEGPFGAKRRGAWFAGIRKSYLQYALKRISDDPSLAFGFFDSQAKANYQLTPKNELSLSLLDGHSNLDRSRFRARLGPYSIMTADYRVSLANLAWRYAPTDRFLVTNRVAWMREKFANDNRGNVSLAGGQYGEWVWNADATWLWNKPQGLEAGWTLRRLRDDAFTNIDLFEPIGGLRPDRFRGTGLRLGGFAQQSWKTAGGRALFSAGARWDGHSVDGVQAVLPQANIGLAPRASTRIDFGWGEYLQYPDLMWFFSGFGNTHLLPERANHFVAGWEQRLDDRTRVRVEFYARWDRDLLFRSFAEPRLLAGRVFIPSLDAPLGNPLRGNAHGVEVFLQRRSANRLSGWVSYALGTTRLRDPVAGISFPSDQDQRHTANVYLSYRLRPSVHVSVKGLYGSGFPIPGFFRRDGDNYFLSATRNAVRLASYERTDFRIDKAYVFRRSKLTLSGEVINLLNRRNMRFDVLNGYDPTTGNAQLAFEKVLPILPSAGISLEF